MTFFDFYLSILLNVENCENIMNSNAGNDKNPKTIIPGEIHLTPPIICPLTEMYNPNLII